MPNSVGAAVAAPSSTAPSSAARRALPGVLFLAALVASCVLLRRCLPFPELSIVRDKIEYLARHGDEYDVLFLGSSRVHCQIMPAIFDRVAGDTGVPVKSFNAGINGMGSPEDGYLLEEILRRPHRRLRWVFVEISRLGTGLAREDTERFAYWHDTARLVLVVRRVWGQAIEQQSRLPGNVAATFPARCEIWTETAGLICGHARRWLIREVNLGCGREALDRWLRTTGEKYTPGKSLGATHDGWLPMDRKHKEMSGAIREKYDRDFADRLIRPAGKERGDPVSQSALERLLATVTKSGATPLLLVAPTPAERNFFPTESREQELQILDFSDVRKYPGLFSPEHRIDGDHLNTAGAELFSTALARRFAELAKQSTKAP